jgi:E3 ubiquitin-protein ligase RHF
MDEKAKMESKLSSAAAFVEGGVQDACDDATAAAKYFGCF